MANCLVLHALCLSVAAAQQGRPRVPPEWSCRGPAGAAMQKLRGKVGHMITSPALPVAIVDGDELSLLYRAFMDQDSCWAARWTMELLTVELYLERLSVVKGGDWMGALAVHGDVHYPFSIFFRKAPSFFETLLWGDGPAWSSIAAGGWSTFALIGRFIRALRAYITALGTLPREAVQAILPLLPAERQAILSEVPELLSIAAGPLNEANLSSPWPYRAMAAAAAEDLLRNWTRRALDVGLSQWSAVAWLLINTDAWKFWHLLDRVLLPDGVRLCLPKVVVPHSPSTLHVEPSSQCAAAHCTRFWGMGAAMQAASTRVANNGSATAVFRLELQHNLLNNKLRNSCSLKCPPRLVTLLQTVSGVLKDFRRPLTFVDVGAALGDCMVVAAFLLPAGRLRGIAFEAHPGLAARARDTFLINGMASALPNTTQVMIKRIALGAGSFHLNGSETDAGFNPIYGITERRMVVKGSNLDAELERLKHVKSVDLLHVFTNVGEAAVLRGAWKLLQAQRVGCVLLVATQDRRERRPLYRILRMSGYHVASMDNPQYHVASPIPALERSGGTPCDARFFRWWLRRDRERFLALAPAGLGSPNPQASPPSSPPRSIFQACYTPRYLYLRNWRRLSRASTFSQPGSLCDPVFLRVLIEHRPQQLQFVLARRLAEHDYSAARLAMQTNLRSEPRTTLK